MRAACLLLLMLVACSAPMRHPPAVPAPPVLDETSLVQLRRQFSLRGNVAPDAVVRLYVDSACAGPVLLQTSGEALRQGVTVELISGVDNVFTADAVSGEGGVSACSNAVTVQYVPAQRPGQPSVALTPASPSSQRTFTLRGAIDGFARAQLHEWDCDGPVVAELDPSAFFSTGFVLEAPRNGARTVAVDAVNQDQRSVCVAVTAINDTEPPELSPRLASPTPSSSPYGYVVLTGEQVPFTVYAGPGCTGRQLAVCRFCYAADVPFFPDVTTFSVGGSDSAGNFTCADGNRSWVHDPFLPEEQAIVLLPGTPPQAEVPWGRSTVEVFHSADCSGAVETELPPAQLVNNGLFWLPPSGMVSVRSYRVDGGADPCSNPVSVQ